MSRLEQVFILSNLANPYEADVTVSTSDRFFDFGVGIVLS